MALRKKDVEQDPKKDEAVDPFEKYRVGPHESIPDPKADNDIPEHISVEPQDNGK